MQSDLCGVLIKEKRGGDDDDAVQGFFYVDEGNLSSCTPLLFGKKNSGMEKQSKAKKQAGE